MYCFKLYSLQHKKGEMGLFFLILRTIPHPKNNVGLLLDLSKGFRTSGSLA